MKRFFAILLSLIMLLSCVGGMAEEETPDNAAVLLGAVVNADTLVNLMPVIAGTEANENTTQILNAVLAVLNRMCFVGAVDAGENECGLDVVLNDQRIGTIVTRMKDGKMQIASSLFPSYVLTTDEAVFEEVEKLLPMLVAPSFGLDTMDEIAEALRNLPDALGTATDAPEKNEYTIEGAPFDTCTTRYLSKGQLGQALEKVLDEMSKIEQIGQMIPTEEIEELRKDISGMTEDEKSETVLEIMMYTREDGTEDEKKNVYYTVEIPAEVEMTLSVAAGRVNDLMSLHLLAGNQVYQTEDELRAAAEAGEEAATIDFKCKMLETGCTLGADVVMAGVSFAVYEEISAPQEDKSWQSTTSLYLYDEEMPLLTIYEVFYPGQGQMNTAFDDSDMLEISLAQLMEDTDAQNALLQDLQANGLSSLLGAASQVMPEEMNALISLFMPAAPAVPEPTAE